MNPDDFAAGVIQRLSDPASVSMEPMTLEEIRQLTPGDVEALKAAAYPAWCAMIIAHADLYDAAVEKKREQNREYQRRIDSGREYPGVIGSLKYHIQRNEEDIALWEAVRSDEVEHLDAAIEQYPEAWKRLRGEHHLTDRSDHPTARYYNNRIAVPLSTWYCITGGGKHAPV